MSAIKDVSFRNYILKERQSGIEDNLCVNSCKTSAYKYLIEVIKILKSEKPDNPVHAFKEIIQKIDKTYKNGAQT